MTYSILSAEQIQRLRAYGAEAPGSFPVADHAPRPAAPTLPRRPTYDADALAEINASLAAVSKGVAELGAAFARRKAQATADAAARAAGRLTESERSDVLRRSHAVADAAAAPNRIHAMNARAAEVWGRKSA